MSRTTAPDDQSSRPDHRVRYAEHSTAFHLSPASVHLLVEPPESFDPADVGRVGPINAGSVTRVS